MEHGLPTELHRLLHAGDDESRQRAWQSFVDKHSGLLLHTARTLWSDYDVTMDHYTFILEQLRADDFRRLRAYTAQGETKFSTWLVVVARRLCVDYDRVRYGRRRSSPETASTDTTKIARRRLADLVAAEIDVASLGHRTTPESELLTSEFRKALDAALSGLPPADRLLLSLRFEEGASVREIKDILQLPTPFHVYRRLRAVLREIREVLERQGLEGP